MSLWRWLNRQYAAAMGYFWLPCPLCGEYSGGHEWRDRNGLPAQIPAPDGRLGISVGICPKCTLAGKGVRSGE